MTADMTTSESPVVIRHYAPGDEVEIVSLLNDAFPGGWGSGEKWDRRHRQRPGFEAEDIWLASSEHRLVGCLHTALFQVALGDGARVTVAMDGDLAIRKIWTGRGISEALYARSASSLLIRGAVLRLGYSESAIRVHYYTRVLGYMTGFDRTRCYKKHLEATWVRDRIIESLRGHPGGADAGRGPILEIRLTDLQPIKIRLAKAGPTPANSGADADLVLTAGQALISELAGGGPGAMARAVLAGRARLVAGPIALARAACWTAMRNK